MIARAREQEHPGNSNLWGAEGQVKEKLGAEEGVAAEYFGPPERTRDYCHPDWITGPRKEEMPMVCDADGHAGAKKSRGLRGDGAGQETRATAGLETGGTSRVGPGVQTERIGGTN